MNWPSEHFSKGPAGQSAPPVRPEVFTLLLEAHACAWERRCSLWEFAVEIQSFRALGVTSSALRWLVHKGYVEHGVERTPSTAQGRLFHKAQNLAFTDQTCFVLTASGLAAAQEACGPAGSAGRAADGTGCVPHWDGARRDLRLGDRLVKQFRLPAPNQELILAAFQEEGWPPVIDDPLPRQPGQDPKERLHETIKSLNRNQVNRLLRFRGNGDGCGIAWELLRGRPPELP
jgi:hypothetical protein